MNRIISAPSAAPIILSARPDDRRQLRLRRVDNPLDMGLSDQTGAGDSDAHGSGHVFDAIPKDTRSDESYMQVSP